MPRAHVRQRSSGSRTINLYLGIDPLTGKKRYKSEMLRRPKRKAELRLTEYPCEPKPWR